MARILGVWLAKLILTMDNSRWKLVRDLFDASMELPARERSAYLAANCLDSGVRQQLEQLLDAHQGAGEFLNEPVVGARELLFQQVNTTQPVISVGSMLKARYQVLEKIGVGGFGDVYLARDEQLAGRKVVVKSLRKGQVATAGWLGKRFQQEMEALARIDHPGVASVYDTGEGPGGDPFLVMQYLPGGTLRDAMAAGPMSIARVTRLAWAIADALDAAHHVEVLHRDLKPENIILRDAETVKELPVLIDFGIARVEAKPATTTHVSGSPMYMAPEQLLGRAVAASDQYALALVLFELLAGKTLYELEAKSSPAETAEFALQRMHPVIPNKARQAICRSLSFDPAKRFEKCMDLATALIPPARRRIGPVIAAATVGALAMAGAFFGLRAGPEAEVLSEFRQSRAEAAAPSMKATVKPAVLGVTLWRFRPSSALDQSRVIVHEEETNTDVELTPERISLATLLLSNDRIRLSIEAAQTGHLYVASQELYPGGKLGQPYLIFPSKRMYGGSNRVESRRPVDIPELSNRHPYLKLKRSRPDQVAEVLTIWVTPSPLPGLMVQSQPVPIDSVEWDALKKKWGANVKRIETSAAPSWSAAEKAASERKRPLSPTDPLPQNLYKGTASQGLLFSVPLSLAQ